MINILIVDDSETESLLLKNIFEDNKDLKVVALAKNGKEAIELVEKLKPDIVTMDIQMPIMDGIQAIKHIMAKNPLPIIVISSKLNDKEMNMSFNALEAGALSVLEKPSYPASSHFDKVCKQIVSAVRHMAEIKVVRRKYASRTALERPDTEPQYNFSLRKYDILAIGTSVGGPQVLKTILSQLSFDFPVPIVIVQHMTPGFIEGFVKWLNDNISLTVKEAEENEILRKGVVYFAPDKVHLIVERIAGESVARLVKSPPVSGFCPSATVLLKSIAACAGKKGIGVLLTGMGNDGAEGLLAMKQAHAHTLIQDEASAVVFGMAAVALSLGAVDKIITLDRMADYLRTLTNNSR